MSEPLVPNLTRLQQLQEALQAAATREAWLTARLERAARIEEASRNVLENRGMGDVTEDLLDHLEAILEQDT